MQQQSREFQARLPATGEFRDGALQIRAFQLELPGQFTAFPVGLIAIAHQIFERSFPGKKWIVLTQITQPEAGMADDFAAIEFFLTEQNPEQCAFPCTVSADKPHLDVVVQSGFGTIQ